jgi:iron(III) transport system permease protein
METLADFGTVAAFNYDTFTTAIYKAWFALFSIDSALQLAGVLILLVLALLALQGLLYRRRAYTQSGPLAEPLRLRGASAVAASTVCAVTLMAGFGVPVTQLLIWSASRLSAELDWHYLQLAFNSLSLGLIAAALVVSLAMLLAYAGRQSPTSWTRTAGRVATLGYAFPGALLAIGLFVPMAALIRGLNHGFGWHLSVQGGLLLMLAAYAVRFMAVAHAPLQTGLGRIRRSLDEASQLMGVTGAAQVRRVHLPLLRPWLLTAFALVLVDVMKEMPITLMTRPFGWDTLAVRVFELTSEGEWKRAALPALGIVLAGLAPVMLLMREMERRPGSKTWS